VITPGPRLRIVPDTIEAKCRIGRSRPFPFLDRLYFLIVGRLWVSTINGKAHTSVVLSTRRPK
jgi:hypothetical protein